MTGLSPGRGGSQPGGLLQRQPQAQGTPPRAGSATPFVPLTPVWPTCVRIELAPEDVSNADVFDYFDGLSITSNGVHIHQTPGSGM